MRGQAGKSSCKICGIILKLSNIRETEVYCKFITTKRFYRYWVEDSYLGILTVWPRVSYKRLPAYRLLFCHTPIYNFEGYRRLQPIEVSVQWGFGPFPPIEVLVLNNFGPFLNISGINRLVIFRKCDILHFSTLSFLTDFKNRKSLRVPGCIASVIASATELHMM